MDSLGRNTKNSQNAFNLSYNSNAIQKNSTANTPITYFYISSGNIISPHALGQIRYNNINKTIATQIHISYITNDLIDVKESILKISPFSKIYIQDKLYNTSYIEYTVNMITDRGMFMTLGVSVLRSADANNFANLLEVILKIQL